MINVKFGVHHAVLKCEIVTDVKRTWHQGCRVVAKMSNSDLYKISYTDLSKFPSPQHNMNELWLSTIL